jgi:hypothetical protein
MGGGAGYEASTAHSTCSDWEGKILGPGIFCRSVFCKVTMYMHCSSTLLTCLSKQRLLLCMDLLEPQKHTKLRTKLLGESSL